MNGSAAEPAAASNWTGRISGVCGSAYVCLAASTRRSGRDSVLGGAVGIASTHSDESGTSAARGQVVDRIRGHDRALCTRCPASRVPRAMGSGSTGVSRRRSTHAGPRHTPDRHTPDRHTPDPVIRRTPSEAGPRQRPGPVSRRTPSVAGPRQPLDPVRRPRGIQTRDARARGAGAGVSARSGPEARTSPVLSRNATTPPAN